MATKTKPLTMEQIEERLQIEVNEAIEAEEQAEVEFERIKEETLARLSADLRKKKEHRKRVEKSLKSLRGEPLVEHKVKQSKNGKVPNVSEDSAEKLEKALKKLDGKEFTVADMEKASGVSHQTVRNWVTVKRQENELLLVPSDGPQTFKEE